MLSPLEMKRMQEIDRRLADIAARREKIAAVHSQTSRTLRTMETVIGRLNEEKSAIEQGQLLFHVEQSA